MTSPRVLCLGEVLFDFLADQLGVPLEAVSSWTPYPGGAPANVACGLTKLGTTSGFIGCVGKDASGAELLGVLQECGVNLEGVQQHLTAPTRGVYVVRSPAGDRHFAGFGNFSTTEFADAHLQADRLPPSLFEGAEYLVLGTLELAYPDSSAAIARALDLADQYYLKVLVDVNWRTVFWTDPAAAPPIIKDLLTRIDFLKLSREEAEWLFDTNEPAAIAEQLDHLEGVLITDGDAGCTYSINGHQGRLPAFAVDVEDTTGAGDGFVAGFVHQLCRQGIQGLESATTVQQMVTYASAVGGLTATRAGAIAAQPTAAEVEAFLFLRDQPG